MKKESVWLEFTPLSNYLKSINLGQGFPGWEPEQMVRDCLRMVCEKTGISQYSSPKGEPVLRQQIAKSYQKTQGRQVCAETEVLVTVGASEGIYLAIKSLVKPGEEVIILEPFFDLYEGAIASCAAVAKYVSLNIPKNANSTEEISLDLKAIKEAITDKTSLLIINTPHNPTGKVFSRKELESLAELLEDFPNVNILSDEVYEHLVYDGKSHVSPASIETLKDKTVCLYSAGKTFSITGWKIGWAIGNRKLIEKLTTTQQWVVFSVATPLQHAVAELLRRAEEPYKAHDNFYKYLKDDYQSKRDLLLDGLKASGFKTLKPEGSFFIMASSSKDSLFEKPESYEKLTEKAMIKIDMNSLQYPSYNLSRNLSLEHKVTTIPMAAFLSEPNKSKNKTVRFAFCKKEKDLKQAIKKLQV